MKNSTTHLANDLPAPWQWWSDACQRAFGRGSSFAPSFMQPILPGWTFSGVTINDSNSSDPAVERAIVREESYGRQLGRLMDAMEAIIAGLPDNKRDEKPLEALLALKRRIDRIKRGAESAAMEGVLRDLATLKSTNEDQFNECLRRIDAMR